MRGRQLIGLVILTVGLSGCAGSPEASTSTVTATETLTVTASPEAMESDTYDQHPAATEQTASAPSETDATGGSESTEIALPPSSSPLGLHDFFNPDEEWEEGRWNVANRTGEQGLSRVIPYTFDTALLELRLQNEYSSLGFDAGQANDSESSECLTKVDVTVDGEVRETREIGFNTIQNFSEIDVRDGNSVKLEATNTECEDSVRLVLSNIELQ